MDKYESRRTILNLMREARRRAKERGVEFNLLPEDVPWNDNCPIMECPLERNKGHVQNNSPTLDRIHSDRGYVKGNVRVICWRANNLKGNLTTEQAENLLLYMKGHI